MPAFRALSRREKREKGRSLVLASPPEETRRSILARAALLASGVGIGALVTTDQAAAAVFNETLDVVPPADQPALRLVPSGAVPPSASIGGALNLNNTASTGAGAVLYSNRGADALGRLLLVNQGNAANPQHAVRIQNAGTAHTVSIFHDPAGGAGDPTAEAVDIVSTNPSTLRWGSRAARREGAPSRSRTPSRRTSTPALPRSRSRSKERRRPVREFSSATRRTTSRRASS